MSYSQTIPAIGSERRFSEAFTAMPGYPQHMPEWPQQPSDGGWTQAHEICASNGGFGVSSTLPGHSMGFAPQAADDVSLHKQSSSGAPLKLQAYNRGRMALEASFPQLRPEPRHLDLSLCCCPNCPIKSPSTAVNCDWRYHEGHPAFAQAPMLQSRRLQLSDMAPPAPTQYVAPTEPGPGRDAVSSAFSRWYADFVTNLLIYPGNFRKGAGGACAQLWGPGGREKEAWLRIRWNVRELTAPWARLGTTPREAMSPIQGPHQPRMPWLEKIDPYNVRYGRRSEKPSTTLVDFVHNMVNRMSLSPKSILHAAYFLTGVGLHEGDGDKGAKLRKLLVSWYCFGDDQHAVEKRVAMLGVLLAGKWLDDNSFAARSYSEVADIPMLHIDQLERTVLLDLHHSLFVHLDSWVAFIRRVLGDLVSAGDLLDDHGSIALALVHQTLQESLKSLATMPPARPVSTEVSPFLSQYISPNSSPETKHALLDAWRAYDLPPVCRSTTQQPAPLPEMFEDEEDDEDEWLDYDGATRFLPPLAEMRRSMSNSSEVIPGLTRNSAINGAMPSRDSMGSLPRTPSTVFAPRERSPAVVPPALQPNGDFQPAHHAQAQHPPATDSFDGLYVQLACHLPSLKDISHFVAHADASSAEQLTQPAYPQYQGPGSYDMAQRHDTAPVMHSYGGGYQYSQAPAQQLPPLYNPYHQAGGVTREGACPALPIHVLIGNDVPYVGYGQS